MKMFRTLALSFAVLVGFAGSAWSQCSGQFPANTFCGNNTGALALPGPKTITPAVFQPIAGGTVIGNPTAASAVPIATATPILGIPGSVLGTLGLAGSSSGTVSIRPQAAAGTWNFNLPVAAGTAGQPLLSGGGAAAAQTYGTLQVPAGGTGLTGGTSGGVPYFNSTTTMASSALLAANQLVLGGGAAGSPATLGSLGTTTTVLHGNAAGVPAFGAVVLTADVSGILPLANGGTNANLTASNGGIVWSNATQMQILAGTATAGQMLRSGSTATPAWSTATWPATTAAGTLLTSAAANTVTASAVPVLGVPGTTLGTLGLAGNTSGTVTLTPQATAGTVTLTLPNASGTVAAAATSPLVLSATTGVLTCPTCATSSGGGAITGTSPISVSASGVVSIPSLTGTGATVVLSASPTLSGAPFIAAATGTSLAVGGAAGSAPPVPLSVNVNGDATILLNNTSQGANAKIWDFVGTTNVLGGRAVNDAYSAATNWLAVTRSGFLITSVAFPSSPVVLGTIGSVQGSLAFSGATSGSATVVAQAAASTPTLTLPTSTGTFAVVASSPLVLSATTGTLTCPTCATSSGGGAITGTAPISVSAAGVVSLNANGVTYALFQQVAASSLVGNPTGSLATAQGITLGATLTFSGTALQTLAHTGDITTPANSFVTTLATVNANVGTFGSATQAGQFTVNGKGLITAASNVTITPAVGSITGLGAGVATWLATPTSANLAAAVATTSTGSGSLVFGTTPTIATAVLNGTVTGTSVATAATGSTLVQRDGSGNITGAALLGTQLTISDPSGTTVKNVVAASQNWSAGNALNVMGVYTAYGDVNRFIFQRANGTIASPTAVLTGETIMNLGTRGYYVTGGPAFSANTTIIMATAEENYTSTTLGTRLAFFTTPLTTATVTEAMRIQPSGGVSIGTASDPGVGLLYTNSASFMLRTKTSLTGGATGNIPTLTAGPVTGNPTKWLPYDDNGTTRYIPAW